MNCSALIVTYNRLEKLKLTIANTVKLNFTAIVVVNNGSTDGTQAWLATLSDPRVIVLNLPSNSGGAGGFKAGSLYLCDNVDSDWVFFYDDDAWPESDALEKFAQLEKANCRVFTALVKDLQGQPCPMNMPFAKVPSSFMDTLRYIRNPAAFLPSVSRACAVQTVSFVGMIIQRDVLQKRLHSIHDELFLYFDDLYFGYQLTLDGEAIRYSPEVIFTHDVSIQGKCIVPEWKVYYLCRNLILEKTIFPRVAIFSRLSILLRLIKYVSILPWQRNKLLYFKYLRRGIIHGVKGISGKNH
ncbi:glycosyltransferase [Klebsiella michiganensis]|uniref:glycosyltransferase n=1 Tax=Klebsiella michiganensis TaxID=1134687 RepID=UPI000D7E40D2|nr:glycosyltransferase [Klebsiella michiganensis]AWT18118.1 glycosyl transferase [Klebsiella michiganensis]HDY3604232.1 glycosyltransferase [Klebsiella michiganensis]